jgi:hypothetical protein
MNPSERHYVQFYIINNKNDVADAVAYREVVATAVATLNLQLSLRSSIRCMHARLGLRDTFRT